MKEKMNAQRFYLLLAMVMVTGVTQGLLLPLLATLLEEKGVSSSMNGLNAASLYIGILAVAPFCGSLVRRFGYRQIMIVGLALATGTLFLFPVFTGFYVWMFLRFVVGVGDSLLHYATQLWITTDSPPEIRGRRISLYGLCYGMGFGLGPLGVNLLKLGDEAPFVIVGLLMSLLFVWIVRLENVKPEQVRTTQPAVKKVFRVYRWVFIPLCLPLLYGFLEASLSGSFPVYGLREGISTGWISLLISAFVYGSLLFQVPLGIWSDRWGRRKVSMVVCSAGAVGMALIPMAMGNLVLLLILFTLVGGLLGSLYSLGLAYMADLLPVESLPEGNALASVHFAFGCMIGPYAGGWMIDTVGGGGLFYLITGTLVLFVLTSLFSRPDPAGKTPLE